MSTSKNDDETSAIVAGCGLLLVAAGVGCYYAAEYLIELFAPFRSSSDQTFYWWILFIAIPIAALAAVASIASLFFCLSDEEASRLQLALKYPERVKRYKVHRPRHSFFLFSFIMSCFFWLSIWTWIFLLVNKHESGPFTSVHILGYCMAIPVGSLLCLSWEFIHKGRPIDHSVCCKEKHHKRLVRYPPIAALLGYGLGFLSLLSITWLCSYFEASSRGNAILWLTLFCEGGLIISAVVIIYKIFKCIDDDIGYIRYEQDKTLELEEQSVRDTKQRNEKEALDKKHRAQFEQWRRDLISFSLLNKEFLIRPENASWPAKPTDEQWHPDGIQKYLNELAEKIEDDWATCEAWYKAKVYDVHIRAAYMRILNYYGKVQSVIKDDLSEDMFWTLILSAIGKNRTVPLEKVETEFDKIRHMIELLVDKRLPEWMENQERLKAEQYEGIFDEDEDNDEIPGLEESNDVIPYEPNNDEQRAS